jgi:hypothetical protein
MMKNPDYTPSAVVRNSVAGGSGVSSNSNATRIVTLMESGLLRNKIDVRDRALFDRVLTSYSQNNQSINYMELGEKTQTDLLFEITDYTIDDYYEVKTYTVGSREIPFNNYSIPDDSDPKGKRKILVKPSYEFRGMSIEIKVIVLKDNTIGGTYKYFYVPCSEEDGGCEIISFGGYNLRTRQFIPLKYKYGKNQAQDVDDIMGGNYDNNKSNNSNKKTTRGERIDQAMSSFITDKVIPSMLAHMRGGIYQEEEEISDVSTTYIAPTRRQRNSNPAPDSDVNADVSVNTPSVQNTPPARNTAPPAKTGPSKNSYNIAQSASNLISQQFNEQESKSKKPKEGKTDEERLRNLKQKALKTVDQFIISSITAVGSVPEESVDEVIIFSKSNSRPARSDFSLFCFVDNKCVGVGSSAKGIFTSFPKDQFEFGFHRLSLGICNADSYIELFNSQVDFSIKNSFIFEWNGRSIKLAN